MLEVARLSTVAVHRKVYPVDFGPGTLGPSTGANDMTDVTVTNRRADSSANENLTQLARHGADAFGYKANLRIDRKLAQLLRLRVSQINNCTYWRARWLQRPPSSPCADPDPGFSATLGDQPNSSRNPSRHDGYSRVSPNSDLALALLAARSWVP